MFVSDQLLKIITQDNLYNETGNKASVDNIQETQQQKPKFSGPGLLLPLGSNGSWDSGLVGNPVIKYFTNAQETRWVLWYSGRSSDQFQNSDLLQPVMGTIGVATSQNGLQWTRGSQGLKAEITEGQRDMWREVGQCLDVSSDWWTFDTLGLAPGDVQMLANQREEGSLGVYHLYYTGSNSEESNTNSKFEQYADGKKGLKLRIGLALSQDGRLWARHEGDHPSGAVIDTGDENQWDSTFVAAPHMITTTSKQFRIYYHSFDKNTNKFTIGAAESDNGFVFKKVSGPLFNGSGASFDSLGARNGKVIIDPSTNQYILFYEGVNDKHETTIGLAVSKDGLTNWQSYGKPILQNTSEGSNFDSGSVGSPQPFLMQENKIRLYYCGRTQEKNSLEGKQLGWQGIGLALSDNSSEQFNGIPTSYLRYTQ